MWFHSCMTKLYGKPKRRSFVFHLLFQFYGKRARARYLRAWEETPITLFSPYKHGSLVYGHTKNFKVPMALKLLCSKQCLFNSILISMVNIYNNNIDVKSYTLDDRWYKSMLSVIKLSFYKNVKCICTNLLFKQWQDHMHKLTQKTLAPNNTFIEVLNISLPKQL